MNCRLKELLVLEGLGPSASDINVMKLARFAGVPVRRLTLADIGRSLCSANGSSSGTAVSACAVACHAQVLRECGVEAVWHMLKRGVPAHLFVFGFTGDEGDDILIEALSDGALTSARKPDRGETEYAVNADSKWLCQEFSGLTFGPTNPANDVVFHKSRSDRRVQEHVRIGGNGFVVTVRHTRVFTVLTGSRQILDIDASVDPGTRALDWFSQLVPAMLFLRYAFGDRCWQPASKLACFIVDDPLLRSRYGFLRYDSLLEAMERSNFATSLAFVPWNYNRSYRRTAELFLSHPKRFSLSIHGCDHTKGEFGSVDEVLLSKKAAIARKRMERHRELTGVSFDDVMVFPQGVFSSVALKTLKTTGYLAAVNSTPFPVDRSPESLHVRDLLAPAITRYSAFPLFVRHYPNCIAEFALDLFLGKPALIVEHHDYFRNGYEKVQALAEQINRLSDAISWCGLEDIVRATCLKRQRDDGTFDVQFYHNRTPIVDGDTDDREFVPRANLPAAVDLPSMNGDSDLQFGLVPYRIGVAVRRYLCEFRDNYLSRNRAVVSGLNMLKSKLAK
jgi:hypothetical protein